MLAPADVASSPDTLVRGEVWRLFTSALVVHPGLPSLQLALLAAVAAAAVIRHGAAVSAGAAVAAHVGSALIAYAAIGIAVALGSASATHFAGAWDYGISCLLAGLAGMLCAGALRGRRRVDIALVAITATALVAWLATSDWYGIEHPIAFAIGAIVLRVSR